MTRSSTAHPPVLGILVGHGSLPGALLEAASSIVGTSDGVVAVPTRGLSAADMESRLSQVVGEHPECEILILVDLHGSSCSNVSAKIQHHHPANVRVVTGVNLPMLIRFLYYRQRLRLAELTELMRRTGQEEIRISPC